MDDGLSQTEIMKAKGWLPAVEVGRHVGKTKAAVYRWIKDGKVISTRIGATWYVEVKSVAKHLGVENAKRFFPHLFEA